MTDPTAARKHYCDALDYCRDAWPGLDEWFQTLRMPESPQEFLQEYAWVVYNSGMSNSVIRKHWTAIVHAFHGFLLTAIVYNRHPDVLLTEVLSVFGSERKARAVLETAQLIVRRGWTRFRDEYLVSPDTIGQIPYMGPALRYHLAKNFGLPYAKPDVHLRRLAAEHGWGDDVQGYCQALSDWSGDPVGYVDSVLWAFAARYREIRPGVAEQMEMAL